MKKNLPAVTPTAVTDASNAGEIHIEYVRMCEIKKWPRNPKLHDESGIRDSMKRFGFVQPLLYDETAQQLVAGHGRTEALEAWKATGAPPP